MARKIFISYRREDGAGHAGRVRDRLVIEFGHDLVFMDVDNIAFGTNFVKTLRKEVAKCKVLLALIGPRWLDAQEEDGSRRLDNPNDFVRTEIATALERDIPVIPILLEGARLPTRDRFPKDLEELPLRNGLAVRHESFHSDMDALVRGLKISLVPRHASLGESLEAYLPLARSEGSPRRRSAERQKENRGHKRERGSEKVSPSQSIAGESEFCRPFVRIRVQLDRSKRMYDEVVEYNRAARALYGIKEDKRTPVHTRELIGVKVLDGVRRLSAWMDPTDFDEFYRDQKRAEKEFVNEKWATARVPIRFNSKHPDPGYRNKVFRPIMKLVKAKENHVVFAEVFYYEDDVI